jgi:predicted transcriptional regulator
MNEAESLKDAILANCILQKHRETHEVLGITWSEMCILAAVGLCAQGGNYANMSKISEMATLPYTTATRMIKKLLKEGWITKIDQSPYPVYGRTTDPEKLKTILGFLSSFEGTINSTAKRLDNI